jgi:hypothetical protein
MQTLLITLLSNWVNPSGKFEMHQHMPTKLILLHATTGKKSGKPTTNKIQKESISCNYNVKLVDGTVE